ncbi:hypothetical protein GCM10027082_00640 [Comamonas humi]
MTLLQRNTIASAIFAVMALPALAQTAPESSPGAAPSASATAADGSMQHRRHHGSKEERQARMEQHWQSLKSALKISGSQEASWTTYVSAMKPQQRTAPPMDRKAFAAMTTPERIDAMQTMRSQHQADAERRGQATKAFYATLTPEQQKTFDAQSLKMFGRHHGGHHGPHDKPSAS